MNITTLEQAGRHLMEVGAVDTKTMMVEGRRLLEVCGLDTEKVAQSIARQIDKHGFEVEKDFCTSMGKSTGGRTPTIYHFTLNAANHVLLAAMTEKGKAARQDAIDMKLEQQYQIPQTYAAALLEAGRLAMELEQSQAQLAIAAPKVEFVDKYVQSTGNLGFRQVAKLLKVKENELREFLISNRVMYRLAGSLTPYAEHMDAGRFEVKAGMADHGDTTHAYQQAKFTPKGVEWLAGELAKAEAKKENGGDVMSDKFDEFVSEEDGAERMKWIDFTLCKPLKEGVYIICARCGTVTTAKWFDGYQAFMNSDIDGWIEEKVTHWMPLPKQPKDE